MGDMADFINDDSDPHYEFGGTLSCKYCGEDDLHWEKDDDGKWVLVDDDGDKHECPEVELEEG